MGVAWPTGLQDKLNSSDFGMNFGETNVRSQMETGPYKVRKRFTRALDVINCSILMNRSEYATFRTFYDTSLSNGTLAFTYLHPLTNAMTDFKFSGPPSIRFIQGNHFQVSMNWILA